jgi:hypothetical protein
MAPASQPAVVAELRARLERMTAHGGSTAAALPFGIEAIDEHLPGGGLCLGHLHEVIEAGPASEHAAIASIFAAGILARLCRVPFSGACAGAISLPPLSPASACILTASSTARPGKTATCCRRWKKGCVAKASPVSSAKPRIFRSTYRGGCSSARESQA